MRVFVTGASGFVGSAIVKELLQAGHQVLGLARTDASAEELLKAGTEVHRGNLDDLESLKAGAGKCDAVIHTAFNHDFTRYKQSCEEDLQIIMALGAALEGTSRPLVITSGIGLLHYDRRVTEDDKVPGSNIVPRATSEEAAFALAAQGVNAYILRLPPTTHGKGDHGFVPMVIDAAKANGQSVYIEEGENRWPAVHRFDAAAMYRLIVEKQPEQKVYHAVAEEGVPFKEIATAVADGLQLQMVSKTKEGAEQHFGWLTHFASIDCPASSEQSRKTLGWAPKHTELLEDMAKSYF